MSREEIRRQIKEKWNNYSMGLAMAMSFREDKNYTLQDIEDAFSSGSEECLQIFIRNNVV